MALITFCRSITILGIFCKRSYSLLLISVVIDKLNHSLSRGAYKMNVSKMIISYTKMHERHAEAVVPDSKYKQRCLEAA